MAKRRKRKHRPSAQYIAFTQRKQTQSIIPTITKTAKQSKAETKLIRDSIRKAFSEQQKVTIPTPSSTYNSNKKKNRREARQRRKEKKQKRKQQREQREQQQEQQEQPQEEQQDSKVLEKDDAQDYLDELEAKIDTVYQKIYDDYSWDRNIMKRLTPLDRAKYWVEQAKSLPYVDKIPLIRDLEDSIHLEEVTAILAYRYYDEMTYAAEDIAETIRVVVESFL